MKARIAVTLLLAALLLLSAAAWEEAVGLAQTIPRTPTAQSLAPDGGYRLSTVTWQIRGAVAGNGYRLVPLGQPALTGSGCCCTFLPCVMR